MTVDLTPEILIRLAEQCEREGRPRAANNRREWTRHLETTIRSERLPA